MTSYAALSKESPLAAVQKIQFIYNNNYYSDPLLSVFREVVRKEVPYGKLSRIELHHGGNHHDGE